MFVAVHLRGVDLRAGGGGVAAGGSGDLPVGLIEDNKGVCVEVVVVQGLEAASGD